MNWFVGTSWLWKGLRGQSVTFAALFALGVLGLSIVRVLRHVLSALGAPWYLWLLLPVILVGGLARREHQWMPNEQMRRRWSRGLIFGSLGISLLIARCAPQLPLPRDDRHPDGEPGRWHGPAGK
jgi:hypothetical protein